MKKINKKYKAIITARVSLRDDINLEDIKIELEPINIELKPLDLSPLEPLDIELEPLKLDHPKEDINQRILRTMKGTIGKYYKYELSRSVRMGIARKKALDKSTLFVKKSKV